MSSLDDVSRNTQQFRDFCIIEGPDMVQDFAPMQLQEIQDNIKSRRNKIFLLMEEMRRLRVQERLKSMKDSPANEEDEMPDISSSIPFFPNMTRKTLRRLYITSFAAIYGIILFGGLIAPTLEVKLGLGGTSYADFIQHLHLPKQLSQVDPIVASFSGGQLGVISWLMMLLKKFKYCHGRPGYLACARCSAASGLCLSTNTVVAGKRFQQDTLGAPTTTERCPNCSGLGKKGNVPSLPLHWGGHGN